MPVTKKAHQAQFFETPSPRTNPHTKLGVSAENVQATIETPSNHQGIPRPAKKNSEELFPAEREAQKPMPMTIVRNVPMMAQSIPCSCTMFFYHFFWDSSQEPFVSAPSVQEKPANAKPEHFARTSDF